MSFRIIFLFTLTIIGICGCATKNNWMRDNSRFIDDKLITDITIPGSHLANAYQITSNKPLCIGEHIESATMSYNAKLQQNLLAAGNLDNKLFISFLNTQNNTIKEQLNHGIRYLELQICKQGNQWYTSNVYLTASLDEVLSQIRDFIDSNPKEIIIINLDNRLWTEYGAINNLDSTKLYNHFVRKFSNELIPKSMANNKISDLKASNKQLIILSNNSQLTKFEYIWDSNKSLFDTDAEYSTIKKIVAIETAIKSNQLPDTFKTLPIYSPPLINNTKTNFTNTDDEDFILFNYLNQTLNGKPLVIITNSQYLTNTVNFSIKNNQLLD